MSKSGRAGAGLSRRRIIEATGALAVGLAAPNLLRLGAAFAAYPERMVKIVVANSPGGPSDIIARFMAAALQETMGKTFIVENKGGGGGNIGMGSVARADPDGYTLLLATSAYAVNPGLYTSLPYDPFKDFAAICEIATTPNIFTVRPDLAVDTMKDFVALAKANPDRFNVSTSPVGTTPQLEAEVLKVREGLGTMATIVFTGGGEALQALLGGTVQLCSGTLAPAKTPPEIVSRLEQETLAVLGRPEMKGKLAELGFEVQAKDGKGHVARVAKEVPMFREIITRAGIKPQ